MNDKNYTIKDLDQAVTNLVMNLIDDFYKGVVNSNRMQIVEKIIELYAVIKAREVNQKK